MHQKKKRRNKNDQSRVEQLCHNYLKDIFFLIYTEIMIKHLSNSKILMMPQLDTLSGRNVERFRKNSLNIAVTLLSSPDHPKRAQNVDPKISHRPRMLKKHR